MAEASEGSEAAQQAREGIEAAEQHLPQRIATRIAIMIGVIAFAMAALQFAQRGVQEEADANAKMAGDVWAFYENKSVRATAFQTAAMVLAACRAPTSLKSRTASRNCTRARPSCATTRPWRA